MRAKYSIKYCADLVSVLCYNYEINKQKTLVKVSAYLRYYKQKEEFIKVISEELHLLNKHETKEKIKQSIKDLLTLCIYKELNANKDRQYFVYDWKKGDILMIENYYKRYIKI